MGKSGKMPNKFAVSAALSQCTRRSCQNSMNFQFESFSRLRKNLAMRKGEQSAAWTGGVGVGRGRGTAQIVGLSFGASLSWAERNSLFAVGGRASLLFFY